MKIIITGQKRSDAKRQWRVMVDDEDFETLNQFYWQANSQFAVFRQTENGTVQIHRLIMNAPNDMEVDHIDGNRLNNQKSNLRLATSSQNKCNRGPRKDNTSGYKGVSWHKQLSKWTARIKSGKKYKHLGLFIKKVDAALAYNQAAQEIQKEFAFINKI